MTHTFRSYFPGVVAAATLMVVSPARAAEAPYTVDASTIAIYHFDESPGAADPGNPFVAAGSAGSTHDLTNTGGPDGRDNTGADGYGAIALTGFGTSFNSYASGDGTRHTTTIATGGGATTAAAVLQSTLQGPTGAFTYEAVVNLAANATDEQEVLSHDGGTTRGFLLRVIAGKLSFYSGGTQTIEANLPGAGGPNAFDASKWFHIAVTYDGNEGAADNTKFYWTEVGAGATQANLIGTGTLTADVIGTGANLFGVGTTTRSPFRFEAELIDEVRLSSVARAPGEFLFTAVPEPSGLALLALAAPLIRRRRGR